MDIGASYSLITSGSDFFSSLYSVPSAQNSNLALWDSNGNLLSLGTDFGVYSGLTFTATSDLYYVSVFADSIGMYAIGLQNNDVIEGNGVGETISIGGSYSAALDFSSDVDKFSFYANAGERLYFELSSEVVDLYFDIVDVLRTGVDYLVSSGSGLYFFDPGNSGIYDLKLSSYSFFQTGNYSFNFTDFLRSDVSLTLTDLNDKKAELLGASNLFVVGNAGDNVIIGNSGSNNIRGNDGNDVVHGNNGNDRLYGGNNNDQLFGGNGNDLLQGDAGNDILSGGAGVDTIVFTGATNTNVNLAATASQNTGHGRDTITGVENITSAGGADTLRGNNAANVLTGNDGNDRLYGGNNNDRLFGGNGNDRLDGGAGNDILSGGAGVDTIEGGAGRDFMYAGIDSNRDVFIFRSTDETVNGAQRDRIYQFDSGEDDIHLRLMDANANLAGDQNFGFSSTGAAANSVWVQDVGINILVRGDVNGDTIHDFEIFIASVDNLFASDFIL